MKAPRIALAVLLTCSALAACADVGSISGAAPSRPGFDGLGMGGGGIVTPPDTTDEAGTAGTTENTPDTTTAVGRGIGMGGGG
ncbi:MAG TPA: hypothetical protein VF584_18815 [Longimicrobium sp.]|jgi:hypothetical protein